MTDTLREHVKRLHPKLVNRRKLEDLERDHAKDHHQFRGGHVHNDPEVGPVGQPPKMGGPADQRTRPRGWKTGQDVEVIDPVARMLKALDAPKLTADDIITKVTQAATEADALAVVADVHSRQLLLAAADLLYIEVDGHASAWVRKAIVREARA